MTAENFFSAVDTGDGLGCWRWKRGVSKSGYGAVYFGGRQRVAHAVAYELCVGEIPEGLELDHLCRVRNCVNPSHLEAVTHSVNVRRTDTPPALNAEKTHCPERHPLEPGNLALFALRVGKRVCRTCTNAQGRVRDRRRYYANRPGMGDE